MSNPVLGIIGTAGRREDQGLLGPYHFDRMVKAVVTLMDRLSLDPKTVKVVSGGAAWADHVAVTLALDHIIEPENLTLFIPVPLEYYGYEGPQDHAVYKKQGETANYYHKLFSRTIGRDSIKEIHTAVKWGASLRDDVMGFMPRNSLVAKACQHGHLLAFTAGAPDTTQPEWTIRSFPPDTKADKAHLKDGGTAHTWNLANAQKHHARLGVIHEDLLSI